MGYANIDVNVDVYSTQQNILHFVEKNACSSSYIKKGKEAGRDMVQLCWNAVTELAAKRQIRARKIAVFVAARKKWLILIKIYHRNLARKKDGKEPELSKHCQRHYGPRY